MKFGAVLSCRNDKRLLLLHLRLRCEMVLHEVGSGSTLLLSHPGSCARHPKQISTRGIYSYSQAEPQVCRPKSCTIIPNRPDPEPQKALDSTTKPHNHRPGRPQIYPTPQRLCKAMGTSDGTGPPRRRLRMHGSGFRALVLWPSTSGR